MDIEKSKCRVSTAKFDQFNGGNCLMWRILFCYLHGGFNKTNNLVREDESQLYKIAWLLNVGWAMYTVLLKENMINTSVEMIFGCQLLVDGIQIGLKLDRHLLFSKYWNCIWEFFQTSAYTLSCLCLVVYISGISVTFMFLFTFVLALPIFCCYCIFVGG